MFVMNLLKVDCFSFVGLVIGNVEFKFVDDGEIFVKILGFMKGYWENLIVMVEVIDEDGWFYIGDIGKIDDDGFFFIIDCKKDLLIISGGKNVVL